MVDRLVDFVDRRLEFLACQFVIAAEFILKFVHFGFKIRNVDVLIFQFGDLPSVMHGIQRRVAQKRDDRNEKLRADDVHFRVFVRHVDNARVVQFAVGFQHGHQNRVFAVLFGSVLVQFLEKVFVFVLCRRRVRLVFHFEHHGDELGAVGRAFAKDVIALAARFGVVVLFKIRVLKSGRPQAVELGFAMLFQRFADHFRRHPRL